MSQLVARSCPPMPSYFIHRQHVHLAYPLSRIHLQHLHTLVPTTVPSRGPLPCTAALCRTPPPHPGWRNLATYDGGLSGWRLLWDRWCPVPSWRFSASSASPASSLRPLRYASLINKLTWMTHAASLRRVAAEHRIDLYLRPPGAGAKSGYTGGVGADPAAMDRVVKDAYR